MDVLLIAASMVVQATHPVPPAPQPVVEDRASLSPDRKTHHLTQRCPASGQVEAAVGMVQSKVTVLALHGVGHRMTDAERRVIDRALEPLRYLDRVELHCGGNTHFSVTIFGDFTERGAAFRQKKVSLIWWSDGVTGVAGSKLPALELAPPR